MQNRNKSSKGQKIVIWALLALVVILLLIRIFDPFGAAVKGASAVKLRCPASQDITPFGNDILYYDGMTLYCLNAAGGERWSYTLGENASFHCSDNYVAAWSGTQIHIINKNGVSTYNENLTQVIQFARPGSKYFAVVLGQDASPTLTVRDMQGNTVDDEVSNYTDKIILDMDFFSNGDCLWTLSVDVYASVNDSTLNTYRVGVSSPGSISLGEPLAYRVVYAGNTLNVITTKQLLQYEYPSKAIDSGTKLLYGWQLCDAKTSGSNAMMLFSLSGVNSRSSISQLRLLYGKTDARYSLPETCCGAALYNRQIYAFSPNYIYRCGTNEKRFSLVSLPADVAGRATGYLGMLSGGVALISCENDVYAVTLP